MTYPVGWENITKAVASVYDYYDQVEVLADGEPVSIGSKDGIKDIPEDRTMTIRGISKIVKAPIMITFYNQLQAVDVSVPGKSMNLGILTTKNLIIRCASIWTALNLPCTDDTKRIRLTYDQKF